ncbi:MAG TPA: SelB C-terminal domain-containing protein, partial [Thermomicrobiales bacterium]|nr:SelB C-terminal domain-containing protein [Thermomicrobiales bacterium]
DVPGHERFIKNMLAGVGGIDAALLVIASDEGPMPQTDEHLAILDLLDVSRGLVVLTKRDLVDDEWLELVTEETRERLEGTALADAPIIAVSSTTGDGLPELKQQLAALLSELPERAEHGKPRLPIDRAFTVAGFGTVVTGTLLGGALDVGQEIELLPDGLRARVRGIQSHGRKTDRGLPGARTAVNISGVERDAISRGDVLTTPGWLEPTTLLDVRLRLVRDALGPLAQNDPVDLFIGATEAPGNVTLLDSERLLPGEEGWVQIRLAQAVSAVAGDRFIIRQPSPSLTIGGGRVVDPHPRRHRRFRNEVIAALETKATGTPAERLLEVLARGPAELRAVGDHLELDLAATRSLAEEAIADGTVVALGPDSTGPLAPNRLLAHAGWVERGGEGIVRLLTDFHRRFPLRRGMAREEVKSRASLTGRMADAFVQTLVARGVVDDLGSLLSLPGYRIELTDAQQSAADRFVAALAANPNSPPAPDGFGIAPDLLAAMADLGQIVRLPDNIVFGAAQLAEIQRETMRLIDEHGSLTLAQFRDHFGSSRKYAQAVLEYFDQQRITRRVGDARVRGSA